MGQPFSAAPGSTNADAVVTITPAAGANESIELDAIVFSYDVAPPSPTTLTVAFGSTTLKFYVTSAGPGPIILGPTGINCGINTVTVTLPAAVGAHGSLLVIKRI